MKYFIIAGEASGDIYGSRLAAEIFKQDTNAEIRGWGGDLMIEKGVNVLKHCKTLAFMGYWEILLNLSQIFKNFKICKSHILKFKPDVLILVDYPGFNIPMAKWAKKQGIKTAYYISPKVWAWKEYRVQTMKKCVDKLFVILAFEKEYYQKKHNWDVIYLGHPLVEVVEDYLKGKTEPRKSDYIVLMPGSRRQEIHNIFPTILEATKNFPNEKFVIVCSTVLPDELYYKYLNNYSNITLFHGKSYDALYNAKIAVIKSGTSTLETALMGVPQVVCYKANPISLFIGKLLIKYTFFSLPNLIMNKEIVKELLQKECSTASLTAEIQSLLSPQAQDRIKKGYEELYRTMRLEKSVSVQMAENIVSWLKE